MGLTLTVLGTCGSYPGPGQACSGYLVQGAGTTVWLDAGSGTLANLQRHVEIADVDAVVITHEHPDHWGDLTGLYVACKYFLQRERVPVYAPAGVRERCYYRGLPLDWTRIGDRERIDVGGLQLRFSRTDHPPETLAVRIDGDGRSLAYSADTGEAWSFDRLGSGIDLALCEAGFAADDPAGRHLHLNAEQAGAMARRAGVGRLLLTHLPPTANAAACKAEASDAFGAPVEIATQNERYDV